MDWLRFMRNALIVGLAAGGPATTPASAQQSEQKADKKETPSGRPLRAADSDSPLPEGWPDATAPEKIEVKSYPAYRSAVAQAKGASTRADGILFFSLFNHISKNGIEMTAPVVNTYRSPEIVETRGGTGEMTMEFLYRSTKQGQAGKGVGAVVVKDHPAATFVCLGLIGEMSDTAMRDGMEKLRGWLSDHKDRWIQDGPPRRLGYHGPMTPTADRRWEVQIPIRQAGADPAVRGAAK
ncbi:MAG: heme-binding protein [Isosphaeraceae bacterium]